MVAGKILLHENSKRKKEQPFVLTDLLCQIGIFFDGCLKIKITFNGLFQPTT